MVSPDLLATQKPVGSDQKRQAFSKRKRGLVLKAYQLYKLTDSKVGGNAVCSPSS